MNKVVVSEQEYSLYRAEITGYILFVLSPFLKSHEDLVGLRGAISDDLGVLLLDYLEVVRDE